MQDTAKPVTDLDFPSVTICSSGLNMEAVRQALFNDFANWRMTNQETIEDLDNQQEALNVYMEEKYAMKVGEGNIFDTIKGLNSPPMGETRYHHCGYHSWHQSVFYQVLAEIPLISYCKVFTNKGGLLFFTQYILRGIPIVFCLHQNYLCQVLLIMFRY